MATSCTSIPVTRSWKSMGRSPRRPMTRLLGGQVAMEQMGRMGRIGPEPVDTVSWARSRRPRRTATGGGRGGRSGFQRRSRGPDRPAAPSRVKGEVQPEAWVWVRASNVPDRWAMDGDQPMRDLTARRPGEQRALPRFGNPWCRNPRGDGFATFDHLSSRQSGVALEGAQPLGFGPFGPERVDPQRRGDAQQITFPVAAA